MKRKLYIVAYDIAEERRRKMVRTLLQNYSLGAQKSLYECWFSDGERNLMIKELSALIKEEESLHIYSVAPADTYHLGGALLQRDTYLIIG